MDISRAGNNWERIQAEGREGGRADVSKQGLGISRGRSRGRRHARRNKNLAEGVGGWGLGRVGKGGHARGCPAPRYPPSSPPSSPLPLSLVRQPVVALTASTCKVIMAFMRRLRVGEMRCSSGENKRSRR